MARLIPSHGEEYDVAQFYPPISTLGYDASRAPAIPPPTDLVATHEPVAMPDPRLTMPSPKGDISPIPQQPDAGGGVVPGPEVFEKPKSIKEYLELARQAGQTPTFTDDPTRQMAGMQGGQYQHGAFQIDDRTPRLTRDNLAGGPGQPAASPTPASQKFNLNNPLADPLVVAKEALAGQLDDIWEMVAPGKPKHSATDKELQQFQKLVKERHEALVKAADDRFDRFDKLTKNFSKESVSEALKSGDVTKLERIKKAAGEVDKNKIWDDMVKEVMTDAKEDGIDLAPAELMQRAAEYYKEYMDGLDAAINETKARVPAQGSQITNGQEAPPGAAIPEPGYSTAGGMAMAQQAKPTPAQMLEYARSLKRANPKISDAEIAQGLRTRFPGY